MTINKDNFYLQDIDLLKQLEPIMERKGIEDDEQWLYIPSQEQYILLANINNYEASSLVFMEKAVKIPTYRKDSLEAALPEWCYRIIIDMTHAIAQEEFKFTLNTYIPKMNACFEIKIVNMIRDCICSRGQESLKALAQLIILLDRELGYKELDNV